MAVFCHLQMLLFGLFMWSVFFAKLTKFTHFKSIFECLLVFMRIVVDLFAITYSTFEFDHVVLRHTGRDSKIVLGVYQIGYTLSISVK
jgi:hypothetical protein